MTILQVVPHEVTETPTTKTHSDQTEAMEPLDTHTEAQSGTPIGWMRGRKIVLVIGASMPTGARIPDYRGRDNIMIPSVEHDQFTSNPVWRRWVWAHSHQTWQAILKLSLAPAHLARIRLERAGLLIRVVAQNVDDLDFKGGCKVASEVYGTFLKVECVDYGAITDRAPLHERLTVVSPDYPLDLDPAHVAILTQADREATPACNFHTVPCKVCRGLLRPAVVSFGWLLSEMTINRTRAAVAEADVVLVVNNSLVVSIASFMIQVGLVYGTPLVIISHGRAQYDHVTDPRTEGGASECLIRLADLLGTQPVDGDTTLPAT